MSTSAEVVSKATKILDAIDNHVKDNCPHCRQLLNKIYDKETL